MAGILVVEDHAIVREPLARLLRLEGYRTFCAGNGIEAVEALESEAIDLVLLDLIMPKRDGVSFLEHLRRDARWRDLPVIVMTGMIEGSLLERARALNATTVIFKGRFVIDEFFARIREGLGGKTRMTKPE
jgi:CheY-like chemotaxis protein